MSSTREVFTWIFLVVFPVFVVGCYFLLYWHRRELYFLKRDKSAIIVVSLAGWLAYFTLVASIFNGVPCGVIYVVSCLIAPLSVGPQVVRALLLHGRFEYAKIFIEEEISSREQRQNRQSQVALSTIPSGNEYNSSSEAANPINLLAKSKADLAIDHAHQRIKTTKLGLFVMPSVILVLAWFTSSVEVGNTLLLTTFAECKAEPVYFHYANILFDVLGLVLATMACFYVKNVDDELYMHHEFIETAIIFGITCIVVLAVRLAGHNEAEPLLRTAQQMILLCSMVIIPCCPEWTALTKVRLWLRHKINPALKSTVPGYARPFPHNRASVRATRASIIPGKKTLPSKEAERLARKENMSWDAGLVILLSSEEGIVAFTRHCAREFSCENTRFWCAVKDFRAKFDNTKAASAFSFDGRRSCQHTPTLPGCNRRHHVRGCK